MNIILTGTKLFVVVLICCTTAEGLRILDTPLNEESFSPIDLDLKVKWQNEKGIHPLDPLNPSEIKLTADIIKTEYPRKWEFNMITLREPPKSIFFPILMAENNGVSIPPNSVPRKSISLMYDVESQCAYDIIVNLNTKKVESFKKIDSGIILHFANNSDKIMKNDPRVQKKVQEQGYTMDMITFYTLGCIQKNNKDTEFCHVQLFAANFKGDSIYAHPFDISILFDFKKDEIVSIEDLPVHDQFTPRDHNRDFNVPKRPSNFDSKLPGFGPGHVREDVKPLRVEFPNGPSYTVDGNVICWQKFKFRIGFSSREGLLLHNVVYQDGGKVRPLFYRMSLADLSELYADPRTPYHVLQPIDAPYYGLGLSSNSLVEGEDCIGSPTFFNVTIHDVKGSLFKIPNAICLTEEDDGILWKHTSETTKKSSVVRSRRLTLTQIITMDNYDFICQWHFYQDASISFEIRATGIMITQPLAKGATPFGYGSIVFPQINAPYHQHIFSVRIDPMVDGQQNTVSTFDVVPVQDEAGSPRNLYGNGFTTKKTILKTVEQGRSNISPFKSRVWKISNDEELNEYTNEPVAYKLIPMNTPPLIAHGDSPYARRIGYSKNSIWVTRYKDWDVYPVGRHVNGHDLIECVNLTSQQNIVNEDVVLWHTLNFVHIPRVEDFPVMPQVHTGFMLKPNNFFLWNPALDVPPA